uniref:cytidine deaminase 1-like n=1 Tax=Erigeron canadensis TaxID=72917 RepID=UPI001CB8A71D|nr:cytidine deaminase 1-like [Erigeron canadensis]
MTQPPPPQSKYIISAIEATSMAESQNLTIPQLLPSLVKSAQNLAVPSISKFPVGAVGLDSDGRIFLGANMEFHGLPLHHTIHAEQFLITNLAAHGGGPKLLYVAVSAAPCGHCRQFFQELRGISETQIVITDKDQEDHVYKPILSILPDPFGPYDLLDKETPLILEKHDNQIFLKDQNFIVQNEKTPDLSNGVYELIIKNQESLKKEAFAAARESHAPYSGCPSGVALMDSEGRVYKGSYMESAAHNPSMMPLQAALVGYMVAGGGGGYERIVAAVLVEKEGEGVLVRQEETARLLLKHISPKCDFQVLHCD